MKWIPITLLLFAVPLVSATNITLTPYSDGYVVVNVQVPVQEYTTQVVIPLPGNYSDLLVTDENGSPLQYTTRNGQLIIETGNVGIVNVTYSTPEFLKTEGAVWTVTFTSDEPFTVVLPKGAVLADLSDAPLSMDGNTITMPAGEVAVSYTFENMTTTSIQSTDESPEASERGRICGPAVIGLLTLLPLLGRATRR
ncbi:hypothetical protein [Thermococcus sp.]|uniref:hypothetical protein n=1 Tax=Thermococcus sp. TaxID=35749 RepID=UPI00262F8CC6|nr:hypothetical protein [Thermococcus sp.]